MVDNGFCLLTRLNDYDCLPSNPEVLPLQNYESYRKKNEKQSLKTQATTDFRAIITPLVLE